MFLALKEILYNKGRYRLVIGVILLVTYMIFFLSSLSNGLSRSNRLVIENWQAKSVVVSDFANDSLTSSMIKNEDYKDLLNDNIVEVGQLSVVINKENDKKINTSIFGIDFSSFVSPKIVEGRTVEKDGELVIDKKITASGINLNDKIQINGSEKQYTVVGFTENNSFFTQPAVFMSLADFREIKYDSSDQKYSNILVIKDDTTIEKINLKQISIETLITNIPEYKAQLLTFNFMIGAMVIITFLVLAIFMYIITIQKINLYGIMRAQGISTKAIILSIFYQIFILVAVGVFLSLILILVTSYILPANLPFYSSWATYIILSIVVLAMSLIGGILSIRKVVKIDPIIAIGGE